MTRTWEFSDANAMPVDLVREQDFILLLRRMQRQGAACYVMNVIFSALAPRLRDQAAMTVLDAEIRALAAATEGACRDMSNGDLFLIWNDVAKGKALRDRLAAMLPESKDAYLIAYTLPADYVALRERANVYVELVHHASVAGADGAPEKALNSDAARGPLTAWSLDQIDKLLGDIDLRDYIRIQSIYRRDGAKGWRAERAEHFISIDDLRRQRFPKLDLVAPHHLFLALCETLDQRLLTVFYKNFTSLAGRAVNMNLSIATVTGAAFARFVVNMPREQRPLIGFELHRGDLLQDFGLTMDAIALLKKEGFRVVLDGITPDLAPYLDLKALGADYVKINVARDRVGLLAKPAIHAALKRLPPESLIFFRCDSDAALAAGEDMGVTLFQGWHIDDLAGGSVTKDGRNP